MKNKALGDDLFKTIQHSASPCAVIVSSHVLSCCIFIQAHMVAFYYIYALIYIHTYIVYSTVGTLHPHNYMPHAKALATSYLRCCPLHRYFPSTRNIIYIISNIPSHSKISNLLTQSYHVLHNFIVYFTLHTSSLDTSIFLAARSLCTKPLDAR